MIHIWSTGFEDYPSGQDFGSTMGDGLRGLKEAFKERTEVEHNFTSLSGDVYMSHKVGESSVVGVPEETPVSEGVDGALQYDEETGELKRDTSLAMEIITSQDHGDFTGLTDDDHTIYIKAGGDTITGGLSVPSLTGLPTSLTSVAEGDALSRGLHLSDHTDGGADHNAGVIVWFPSGSGIKARDKLLFRSGSEVVDVASDGTNIRLDGYSTMPKMSTPAPDNLYLECSTVNNDDCIGQFRVEPANGLTGSFTWAYSYLT